MAKRVKIPGRLESAETGGIVTGTESVMDDERGKTQVVINSEVDAAIISLAQGKQDALTFDSAPTEGSPNPVTSAGVYTADKVLSDAIEAILLLIPSAASALNKLVDMQSMNSSIATATASFKGTYNLVSDLHLGVDATHEQIGAALDALSLGADNNDYAFVQVPNSATAPTEIRVTERYKFNGTNWLFEYDLNNSGFTQGQWNAINSGVTSLLVGKLSDLPTNAELTILLAGKQDNLTFDNVPTAGSPNPVKSGGVYARNNEIVALINALDAAKQDVLTFDNAPVEGSPNPVKSGGVYTAISAVQAAVVALDAEKQNVLTFDSTPTLGSPNPVMSSGIKTELNRIDGNITTLNDLYEALTQSALVIVQPTDTWPVASPATSTIYRVVDRVNTPPQNYSDYIWNGSAMVLMATYDNAIDDVPIAESNNLVKSGGLSGETFNTPAIDARGYINQDGSFTENNDSACSGFLSCKAAIGLHNTVDANARIAYYNKNKEFQILELPVFVNGKVLFREGYDYIRFVTPYANFLNNSVLWSTRELRGSTLRTPLFEACFISSHGYITYNADYRCSDYISTKLLRRIEFPTNQAVSVVYYDADKGFAEYESISERCAVDIKDTYEYVRVWGAASVIASMTLIFVSDIVKMSASKLNVCTILTTKFLAEDEGILRNMFENVFISNAGYVNYSADYSCSSFIAKNILIALKTASNKAVSISYYDKDFAFIRQDSVDVDGVYNIPEVANAMYVRYWFAQADTATAGSIVQAVIKDLGIKASEQSRTLSDSLYGRSVIKPDFQLGYVGSNGVLVLNGDYCISKMFQIEDFDKVISKDASKIISYDLYTNTEYSSIILYGYSTGAVDIEELRKENPTAQYITVWIDGNNPASMKNNFIFIPHSENGEIADIKKSISKLGEHKDRSGIVYLNMCNNADDFASAKKNGSAWEDNTSAVTASGGAVTLPYGTDVWSFVKKNIRLANKTSYIDFMVDQATSMKIASFGFQGGANGVNDWPYFILDFANNQIQCSSGATPVSVNMNNGINYRLKIHQEDKHTEVSVINLLTGAESQKMIYNGFSEGNGGLFYDTWAFNPIGGNVDILKYEVVAACVNPFLAMYGDSLTVGFMATVEDGINHNKFAYLVGIETERDFASSGRGGGSFGVLYGGYTTEEGLTTIPFDGILYSELPALMPNYAMLTMGTNGGGTYNQYKQFVEYVLSLGLTPIVNTLPIRADGGTDQNVTYVAEANETIMQIWKDYNIHGARFDLATSLNNDGETINSALFADDRIHPNDAGHAAMAARVKIDCPELFV